jgi:hypothetical protein
MVKGRSAIEAQLKADMQKQLVTLKLSPFESAISLSAYRHTRSNRAPSRAGTTMPACRSNQRAVHDTAPARRTRIGPPDRRAATPPHRSAGSRPERDTPLHRRGREPGEDGLPFGPRILTAAPVLVRRAATREQPLHPPLDPASTRSISSSVGGGDESPRVPPGSSAKTPSSTQGVSVDVDVQGRAEPLHDHDRAAAWVA